MNNYTILLNFHLVNSFCWYCADVPTPSKDVANSDLFSDFLSSDSQPSANYGNQFGSIQTPVALSGHVPGAEDLSIIEPAEQKKATNDAIMALYGTSSVGKFYFSAITVLLNHIQHYWQVELEFPNYKFIDFNMAIIKMVWWLYVCLLFYFYFSQR